MCTGLHGEGLHGEGLHGEGLHGEAYTGTPTTGGPTRGGPTRGHPPLGGLHGDTHHRVNGLQILAGFTYSPYFRGGLNWSHDPASQKIGLVFRYALLSLRRPLRAARVSLRQRSVNRFRL